MTNGSSLSVSGITVQATNVPSWLRFDATAQRIASLRAEEEIPVSLIPSIQVLLESCPIVQLSDNDRSTWLTQSVGTRRKSHALWKCVGLHSPRESRYQPLTQTGTIRTSTLFPAPGRSSVPSRETASLRHRAACEACHPAWRSQSGSLRRNRRSVECVQPAP